MSANVRAIVRGMRIGAHGDATGREVLHVDEQVVVDQVRDLGQPLRIDRPAVLAPPHLGLSDANTAVVAACCDEHRIGDEHRLRNKLEERVLGRHELEDGHLVDLCRAQLNQSRSLRHLVLRELRCHDAIEREVAVASRFRRVVCRAARDRTNFALCVAARLGLPCVRVEHLRPEHDVIG